jgi:antitoxin component YwqK of YwqJK toxin-antitoxin module
MKKNLLFLFIIFCGAISAKNTHSGTFVLPEDSGAYEINGLRKGFWVEYKVDSLHATPPPFSDTKRVAAYYAAPIVLSKSEGNYKQGHREGIWKSYNCFSTQKPYHWILKDATPFKGSFYNGVWKYYSMDGKILIEGQYKEGLLEGKYKEYFVNGKVKSEIVYKGDKKNGKEKDYFENGKIRLEKNYENGYLIGDYKQYYDNGQLRFVRNYKNGILWNEKSHYNRNGKPLPMGTLSEGVGTLNLYNNVGGLSVTYTYNYGYKTGMCTEYYKSGAIKREVYYKKDTMNGSEKLYSEKGQLLRESSIVKGRYDGSSKFYYPSGKPWAEYTYRRGAIFSVIMLVDTNGLTLDAGTLKDGTGTLKVYDDSCRLITADEYVKGKLNGKHLSYYTNGKVHYESNYVNDTLSGSDKIYSKEGVLSKEGNVKNFNWDGLVTDYYSNGKKKYDLIYKDGLIWNVTFAADTNGNKIDYGTLKDGSGTYKLISDSGFVLGIGEYSNGMLNGKYTGYFSDGKLKKEQYYTNDTLNGLDLIYFKSGNIKFKMNMVMGKQDGSSFVYHQNGNMWTERIYVDGMLWNVAVNMDANGNKLDKGTIKDGNGTVNQYDESGKLVAVHQCVNGYVADWDNLPQD